MKVLMIATDWSPNSDLPVKEQFGAVSHYRLEVPAKYLREHGIEVDVVAGDYADHFDKEDMEESGKAYFSQYDVVWTKPCDNVRAAALICGLCEDLNIPLVIDFDDNFFEIPESNPYYKEYQVGGGKREVISVMMSFASAIACSTEPLKEYMTKYLELNNLGDKPCFTLPNCLIADEWQAESNIPDEAVISWHGGNYRNHDWTWLGTTIVGTLFKAKCKFYLLRGITQDFAQKLKSWGLEKKVEYILGTRTWTGFPELLLSTPYSIGLAFVEDTTFNNCKSNIKWLEHSVKGVPTVAIGSPYSNIKHGETGMLATTPEEFQQYVLELVENKKLRQNIGATAKKHVLENYTIDKHGHKWVEALQEITKKHKSRG